MPVVTTGQITIIDQNDARPITAFIQASASTQQIYNPDSAPNYVPDYTSANLTLTAHVYVGDTVNIAGNTALITTKTWHLNDPSSASIGSNATFVVNTNLDYVSERTRTYFFKATYTDPMTGFTTTVLTSIVVGIIRTGSNATYILMTGRDVISDTGSSTLGTAFMVANLYRGSTLDDSVTTYNWYKLVGTTWEKIYVGNTNLTVNIDGTNRLVAAQYGFKLQSDWPATPNTEPAVNTNMPSGAGDDTVQRRGISINSRAVTDWSLFKVEIKDGSDTYETTFTVYDATDPYDLVLVSSAGDKLLNGVGTTYIWPRVYLNGTKLSTLTGWTFVYRFRDKDGYIGGFINDSQTTTNGNPASGMPIASNTTTTFTVTCPAGGNTALTTNDVIKVVKGTNAKYYEISSVASGTTTAPVITIRAAPSSTTITDYSDPIANEFQDGVLFICTDTVSKSGDALDTSSSTSAIIIDGADIELKGTIFCEATPPS